MCLQHSSENVTAAAAKREMKTSRIRRGIIHVTVFKSADNIVLHNGIDLCLGSDQPGGTSFDVWKPAQRCQKAGHGER